MHVQYATEELRELNASVGKAFEAAAGMSPDELTGCRRHVMHGMAMSFGLSGGHRRLVGDLRACQKQAEQLGLGDVVGYCMAAAQSPDLIRAPIDSLLEETDSADALVMEFVRQVAGPGASVLDVGCGRGHFGIALAAEGYRVTLLDPACGFLEAALRRARPETAKNIEAVICGRFEDLATMASASQDVCVCVQSVFYAHPRTSAEEAIVHMGRIAKEAVVVDVMSKEGLIRRLGAEGFDSSSATVRQIRETGVTPAAKPESGLVVYSCFSLDELRQVLDGAGLWVDRIFGYELGNETSGIEVRESEVEWCPYLLALCRTRNVIGG